MSTTNIRKKSVTAALGATVVAAGALVGQGFAAPMAHADQTVTAQEICSQSGLVAKVRFFPPPVVGYCTSALAIAPGNDFLSIGREFPLTPDRMAPGAYKVNPLDPLSDWVIPG